MQAGKISDLLEKEDGNGVGNLAAALKHLTFQNTIDGKFYKLDSFGRYDVGSGKFFIKNFALFWTFYFFFTRNFFLCKKTPESLMQIRQRSTGTKCSRLLGKQGPGEQCQIHRQRLQH